MVQTAIQEARGFKGKLWGLVEKRLTDRYLNIWVEIVKKPNLSSDAIHNTHLKGLEGCFKIIAGILIESHEQPLSPGSNGEE
jgi:hypothetical protein